jgi:hypothetical protein
MVPGGGFPLPPAAAELASQLPPPTSFKGPYVIIDKLCDIFDKIRLPDTFQPASGADQHSVQLFDIARSVQWSVGEDGRKRKSLGRRSCSSKMYKFSPYSPNKLKGNIGNRLFHLVILIPDNVSDL